MDNYTMTLTSAAAARPCVLARPWMTSDDASGMSGAGVGNASAVNAGLRNLRWSGVEAQTAQGTARPTFTIPSVSTISTITTQITRDHAAVGAPKGVKSAPPPRGVPR